MRDEDVRKPRKPWLAAILSLATSGLGQIYNGDVKKGIVFWCLGTLLGCVFAAGVVSFTMLVVIISIVLAFSLYVAVEAYVTARRRQDYTPGPWNRVIVYLLVFVLNVGAGFALDTAMRGYTYQSFKVPSESMLRTLYVGDHFIARILADSDAVMRGDVIVFKHKGRDFVKRVIGLPGERVAIEKKTVSINGVPLTEPYARHTIETHFPERDSMAERTLAQDEYFVMGDNRERSYDSRFLGPVPRDDIFARAEYIYFPGESPGGFDRLGMTVR